MILQHVLVLTTLASVAVAYIPDIPCNANYYPENCDFYYLPQVTVDDYERCAPAFMPIPSRDLFLRGNGRGLTLRWNQEAFEKIQIIPRMMRSVLKNSLTTTILGEKVAFPIGHSPVAYQKFARTLGEIATVKGISKLNTVMIVSSLSTTPLEEIAANNKGAILWMQTYIFRNRDLTADIVRRAEKSGYKALVVTVDAPIQPNLTCNARFALPTDYRLANFPPGETQPKTDPNIAVEDITWLKELTKLPIVVKGILSGRDAIAAIRAGASAILVSNHGGRQMDSAPPTIDVLPSIVKAVEDFDPKIEVYMDSGVRDGFDVYKALARGARFVFVGRPVIWGLVMEGEDGVRNVLEILKNEFNETMILAGASTPYEIQRDTLYPPFPYGHSKKVLKF